MKSAEIVSFGCRLNIQESEVIRKNTQNLENTIIFNTCAVTAEAVRQARQSIRRMRREKPEARIIVTGCAAQIETDQFLKMPEVDLVLGNAEKLRPENYFPTTQKIILTDIAEIRENAGHFVDEFTLNTRAFLQVQNGCDHRCTFCIIPFARGPSRSVPAGVVLDQLRELVTNGYREVVLTGVDLTAYGQDLPGKPTLGNLIRRILKLTPDLERLRISSLDSAEADPELIAAFAEENRLMPHVHLSLQSGDNMILKRMKRRHTREQTADFIKQLRTARPDIVFGADFIAGFPTEDEEKFKNTISLIQDLNITYLHVFPYSVRPNTPAARMPQTPKSVIHDRTQILRKIGKQQISNFLNSQIGQERQVLIELSGKGRTEHYAPVQFTKKYPAGSIVKAKLSAVDGDYLVGDIVYE